MVIQVCIGSSCHLKGSRSVILKLQELIQKHQLEDKISLSVGSKHFRPYPPLIQKSCFPY